MYQVYKKMIVGPLPNVKMSILGTQFLSQNWAAQIGPTEKPKPSANFEQGEVSKQSLERSQQALELARKIYDLEVSWQINCKTPNLERNDNICRLLF